MDLESLAAAGTNDNRAIEDIRKRLEAAENAGSPQDIVELMAEDVVLMVPDQPVQEGKTACADFVREVLAGLLTRFDRRISYLSAEVVVLGDVAFDRGSFSFTVCPKGTHSVTQATGKYFWLLRRGDNRPWEIARLIVSLDQEDDERTSGLKGVRALWRNAREFARKWIGRGSSAYSQPLVAKDI